MYTYNEKLSVELNMLDALIYITENGPFYDDAGICKNAVCCLPKKVQADSNIILDTYIRNWLIHKKLPANLRYVRYPVNNGSLKEYYDEKSSVTIWDNPLRQELLHWLIDAMSVGVNNVEETKQV